MKGRNLRGIGMIAAADLMGAFVCLLLIQAQAEQKQLQQDREEVRQEVEAAQASKAEIEAAKKKLQEEIDALRKKKWKLIATEWNLGKNEKPADASLYCFREGVYESPESRHAMSDAEILAWIQARPKSAKRLFLYVENGGNDSMLRAQAVLSDSGRFDHYSLMTLPSGLDPRN